ncbi:uncharacterized protein LOC142557141 [Dermacentor variabilis]|uniref:uncharacterized protein LOC142557141 n=1 Tax=Dermacentor variabilis TaxID=34621 RepID=UPI003F5C52B1
MNFVMNLAWLACVVTTAAALANARGPSSCESKLQNCTDLVKPFLNDLRYMFPTTIEDVDDMCKMWSRFVDCIRRYVTDCATEDQRSKFNNAVGDSIDTVHAICSSERYQKEYLQNASCFRKVSVDNCGVFYTAMVDQVTNPASRHDHICCSYSQFKSCVSEPLLRLCGNRARTIMDHSMAFLIDRCGKSYYSLSYKCPRARALPLSSNEGSPSPIVSSSAPTAGSGPAGTSTRRPKKSVVSITTWYPRTAVYTLKPTPSSQVSRYSAAASVTPSAALASTLLCAPLLIPALLARSR